MPWLTILGVAALIVLLFVTFRATPRGTRPVARTRLWHTGRWFLLVAAVALVAVLVAGASGA